MSCPNIRCPLSFLFLMLLGFVGSTSRAAEIQWLHEFDQAKAASVASGKPLLIHFYANYCPPCKMLESRAFRDEKLIESIHSNVIAVKVNVDRNREIADQYGVRQWPTDVYLTPSGEELHRIVSPQDPVVYSQLVTRIALRNRDWVVQHNAQLKAEEIRKAKTPNYGFTPSAPSREVARAPSPQLPTGMSPAPIVQSTLASVTQPQVQKSSTTENPFASSNPPDRKTPAGIASWRPPQPTVEQPATVINPMAAPASLQAAQVSSDNLPPIVSSQPNARQLTAPASPSTPFRTVSTSAEVATKTAADMEQLKTRIKQELEAKRDTVAMDGYCPVTLANKMDTEPNAAWQKGAEQFSVRHRGRIYRMASEELRQLFLAAPDDFSPILSGFDVVVFLDTGKLVDGRREFGRAAGGKVYLFADRYAQDKFDRLHQGYIASLRDLFQPSDSDRVAKQPSSDMKR